MQIFIYDSEVYKYDNVVVFKKFRQDSYDIVVNDSEELEDFMKFHEDDIFIGFNSKHYDQYIIKAICCGFTAEEVKQVNDFIIKEKRQGWEHPTLKQYYFKMNNVDIKDDMQKGMSLKSIEGHLGMNIKETEVDFEINRPLTSEEIEQTIEYCKADVNATEKIVELRVDYLRNKINVGKLASLSEPKAMSMTNAKLTAKLLQAKLVERYDEREYVYPNDLLKEYIPKEVFEFFDRIHDKSISDTELFKSSLEFNIGECAIKVAFGGIHGAIPNYIWENRKDGIIIRNVDVGSYYPHLMTLKGYVSRNIPDPTIFDGVLETRMKAKAVGDDATNNALKLVVNTTYGGTLNQCNDLYDPLMARSICISGQLYLLELTQHLYQAIPGLKIVQVNTDGVMVEFNDKYLPMYYDIYHEWEERTGFSLEEDKIAKLVQKDVNNYIEVQENGKIKSKGGYLVRGVSKVGQFKVNNDATIVAKSLVDYFINDIPVEETINNCNDILSFQFIAKAGDKYDRSFQIINGEEVPVQKVNRVYATNKQGYGTLYKVKKSDGKIAKIESLPMSCIVDNENKLTIADIDKEFYIDMAKKQINDFKGVKNKKMAETKTTKKEVTTLNVYQKLNRARLMFLEENVKKSGKNMHMEFMYFELQDIVPVATRIFETLGLVSVTNFAQDVATITIFDSENPKSSVMFTSPFNQIQPIVSNTGKQATNSMQSLGSSITYMRRYLYQIALDICEPDESDANLGKPLATEKPVTKPVTKAKAPATKEERKEVKKELTDTKAKATNLQIKGLMTQLANLRKLDPSKEDWITELAVKTESFTTLTKEECEVLIQKVTEQVEKLENANE